MEFSLPSKKLIVLIFLIVWGSLISTSMAGRHSKFTKSLDKENFVEAYEESNFKRDVKEEMIIHERMLRRVNTNDYGRYDQSPSLPRPRHKLIPN
ncbi:protein CASPARIAN STRIP INTEGRITY FACTOR 1 [Amaranthus tricolor]|uniref:protein CASPARIAN STRIP INTEGRITY FACTOR 1 n=1 Tax=Amaranthus tricolor TaxID=29722 RepID=UPI0025848E2C|nr:protein CASPARIAN STRIP INTEGRITY FACTOR 1 [Amaranthus tricolor]